MSAAVDTRLKAVDCVLRGRTNETPTDGATAAAAAAILYHFTAICAKQ